MNNLFKKAVVACFLLFLAACNENTEPIKTSDNQVFKTQTDALEKAKQVEQVLIDDAETQRKNINAQTQ